ncbi:MAG TPA: hypothetical protein VFP54_09045 [Acidimicrobiales bacterium]|nr:hypothetical protein [Acidimicrobiales bacterium]
MGRDAVNLVLVGRHFALGRSASNYGIWRRDEATKGRPGRALEEFPLTDEGWAAAWAQYSSWEPMSPDQATVTSAYQTSSVTRGAPRTPRPAPPRSSVASWRWAVSTAACAVVVAAAAAVVVTHQPSSTPTAVKGPRPASRSAAHPSGPAPAPAAAAVAKPPDTGYLATAPGLVVFIQWTDEHGILAGTAETVTTGGTVPKLVAQTKTVNLVGTEHGSTVILKLDGQPAAFGTVTAHGFTLNFPRPDGSLAPLSFTSAGASAFDAALSQMRDQAAAADEAAAAAEAHQKAQDQANADAATVSADIDQLLPQQVQVLGAAAAAVDKAVAGETSDTAITRTAEAAVISEAAQYPAGGNGTVCADAGGVASHARGVSSDAASVGAGAAEVESDATSVRQDVSRLAADWSKLQADEAASPGVVAPGQPTAKQVSDATSGADASVTQSVAGTNGDVDQANTDVTAAFGYVTAAYGAGGCGTPPTPPPAQKHIS